MASVDFVCVCRPCFARENGKCTLLQKKPNGKCAFQKPDRETTNGKKYPWNPNYSSTK